MQFSQKLNNLKKAKGLTNLKIAEYANVSEGAVRSWLDGSKTPNIASVALLCEKLNVSVDYLLGIENKEISEYQELLSLWNKLDRDKQFEFKGELKGYIRAKEENSKSTPIQEAVANQSDMVSVYRAARSDNNAKPEIVEMSRSRIDKLKSAKRVTKEEDF